MRVSRLVPILALFLLLSGVQILLPSGQAYAQQCCMCGTSCPRLPFCKCCICGMTGTLQTYGSKGTLKINGLAEDLPFTVDAQRNDALDKKLKNLMREAPKATHKFSLRQSGIIQGRTLSFECIEVDENIPGFQDRTLEFVEGFQLSNKHLGSPVHAPDHPKDKGR